MVQKDDTIGVETFGGLYYVEYVYRPNSIELVLGKGGPLGKSSIM